MNRRLRASGLILFALSFVLWAFGQNDASAGPNAIPLFRTSVVTLVPGVPQACPGSPMVGRASVYFTNLGTTSTVYVTATATDAGGFPISGDGGTLRLDLGYQAAPTTAGQTYCTAPTGDAGIDVRTLEVR